MNDHTIRSLAACLMAASAMLICMPEKQTGEVIQKPQPAPGTDRYCRWLFYSAYWY
ncbi:MAG: hypothetical protein WCL21_15105 [Mariniphaga sp.]